MNKTKKKKRKKKQNYLSQVIKMNWLVREKGVGFELNDRHID